MNMNAEPKRAVFLNSSAIAGNESPEYTFGDYWSTSTGTIPVGEATELTPEQAAAVLVEIVMQKMRQAVNEVAA